MLLIEPTQKSHLFNLAVFLILLLIHNQAVVSASGFTTVINAPPTAVGANTTLGLNTQLNVFDGGNVGARLSAGANSEVNVFGGSVGNFFTANSGSTVNVSGGSLGFTRTIGSEINLTGGMVSSLRAQSGSAVNLLGGVTGPNLGVVGGSTLSITGNEFLVNGAAPANPSSVSLGDFDVLTGTLQDGSVFLLSPVFSGDLEDITLHSATLSTYSTDPIVISAPSDIAPTGLRSGQSLTLQGTGRLGKYFSAVNATIEVEGGNADEGLEVANSVANISGGVVDRAFDAHLDSVVNLTGGSIGSFSSINSGSTLNVFRGSVGSSFNANPNTILNISGGSVGSGFHAGQAFNPNSNTIVNLSSGSIGRRSDFFHGSTINISGGSVREESDAFGNTVINLSGGSIGPSFDASAGAIINVTGGTLGADFDIKSGSIANIMGGFVQDEFTVFSTSTVNISGGLGLNNFTALSGSEVNLFGTEFFINGQRVSGLSIGASAEITRRNIDLSGRLADGSAFSFTLNPSGITSNRDYFSSNAIVTVTLIPEPSTSALMLFTLGTVLLRNRFRPF